MSRKCLFLYLLIVFNVSFAQNIKGIVTFENIKVANAFAIVNTGTTQFTKTDLNGLFVFNKIDKEKNVVLEINALGYETFLANFTFKKDTILNIELKKSTTIIKEIIVRKELNFYTKRDTTKYDISKYMDGSEKVIEDLLKKLPGVDVDKTGRISFKGKEIEALMFDGDDLFNLNYRTGSKNIDVNLIESIEAIENFNNNKVLKNLTESNKVALNLKIKKNASNYSLNNDLKSDFQSRYDSKNSGILISDKLKFYNLLTINNIGINNTPFFLFSNKSITESFSIQTIKNRDALSEGAIPLTLGNENSLFNNNLNISNTFLKKMNKNTKNTFEIIYYQDNINQNFQTINTFSNDVNANFIERISKKPKVFNFSNIYEYNTSKLFAENKTLFEITNSQYSNFIDNNGFLNNSNLSTNKFFLANKTEITALINKKSALNNIFFLSNYKSKQDLMFDKPIDFNTSFKLQNQNFYLNTINLNLVNEYFYSNKKIKIKISNNLYINEDKMSSNTNVPLELFTNDFRFSVFKNDINLDLFYKFKKLSVKFNPTYNYTNLKINETKFYAKNYLINASFRYIVSKKIDIKAIFRQDVNLPTINFLYNNYIIQDFRSLSKNGKNLEILKSDDLNININYSNSLSTLQSQLGFSYQNKINDYLNQNIINQNFVINQNSILVFENKIYSSFFYIHKYISFLKSNMKLNLNHNVLNSNVFIDNVLSPFKNNFLVYKLDVNSAFKTKLNFTNSINYTSNKQFLQYNNSKTSLKQFNNELKVIYLISDKSNFNIAFNYVKPNVNSRKDYSFINFYFEKKINKDKININITGHNLLNINNFKNSNIFNQGFSEFSYNLIERYIMLGLSLKLI